MRFIVEAKRNDIREVTELRLRAVGADDERSSTPSDDDPSEYIEFRPPQLGSRLEVHLVSEGRASVVSVSPLLADGFGLLVDLARAADNFLGRRSEA